MKVIKLDGRYNLKHKGYNWAFRFNSWSPEAGRVERAVKKFEGYRYDATFWGKTSRNGSRPYYIGIKNESTLTMVMLTAGD